MSATSPDELFAIGYAACFESALKVVARREHMSADDVKIGSKVMIVPTKEREFAVGVELDVSLPAVGEADARRLVHKAHAVCPYSNATRGKIDVKLTANGHQLEQEALAV